MDGQGLEEIMTNAERIEKKFAKYTFLKKDFFELTTESYVLYDFSGGYKKKVGEKIYSLKDVEEFINKFDRYPQVIPTKDGIAIIPFMLTNGQNQCWFQSDTRLQFVDTKKSIYDENTEIYL